jgi:hypothetical protein
MIILHSEPQHTNFAAVISSMAHQVVCNIEL